VLATIKDLRAFHEKNHSNLKLFNVSAASLLGAKDSSHFDVADA
jgi:hypothetical protein